MQLPLSLPPLPLPPPKSRKVTTDVAKLNAIDAAAPGDDDDDECHVMHKIESLYNFPIYFTHNNNKTDSLNVVLNNGLWYVYVNYSIM